MSSRRRKNREQMALRSQDLPGFVAEFQRESDRATAILGAALLDEKLLQLLIAFMVDDAREVDQLLDPEGPLGSFGARIRVAYCLGLVTRNAFDILRTIKGIRNAFAHHLHGLSFADPEIGESCGRLRKFSKMPPDFVMTNRDAFLSATLSAQTELWSETMSIEAAQRRCEVPVWKTLVEWHSSKEK